MSESMMQSLWFQWEGDIHDYPSLAAGNLHCAFRGAPKGLIQAVGMQRATALGMLLLELATHLLQECEGQLPAHPLMSNHKVGCMAGYIPSG